MIPFGFDGNNQFWVAGEDRGPLYGSTVFNVLRAAPRVTEFAGGAARLAYTEAGGETATSVGSARAHELDPPPLAATSGGASTSDNRPAYVELVPLMRL